MAKNDISFSLKKRLNIAQSVANALLKNMASQALSLSPRLAGEQQSSSDITVSCVAHSGRKAEYSACMQ
jgi:hypothetical protein